MWRYVTPEKGKCSCDGVKSRMPGFHWFLAGALGAHLTWRFLEGLTQPPLSYGHVTTETSVTLYSLGHRSCNSRYDLDIYELRNSCGKQSDQALKALAVAHPKSGLTQTDKQVVYSYFSSEFSTKCNVKIAVCPDYTVPFVIRYFE